MLVIVTAPELSKARNFSVAALPSPALAISPRHDMILT